VLDVIFHDGALAQLDPPGVAAALVGNAPGSRSRSWIL